MTWQTGASADQQLPQKQQHQQKVRAAYVAVSNALTQADLGRVKFLLADSLDASSLQRAEHGTDLFWHVRNESLLTLDFLAELLTLLGRHDLLAELPGRSSMAPRQPLPASVAPLINSRRLHLYRELDERNLTQRERNTVAFIYKLKDWDTAKSEWPDLVNELLRKYPLDKQAGQRAIADWVREHVYRHIDMTVADDKVSSPVLAHSDVDETTGMPCRSTSVVDEPPPPTSQSNSDDQVDSVEETMEQTGQDGPHGIQAVDFQIMTACYDSAHCLGDGRSARVYKGHCPKLRWLSRYEGLEVAVKVLSTPGTLESGQFHKYFIRELLSGHVLRSPFLLPLICYTCPPTEITITRQPFYALMFPLMSGGDLRSCLFDNGDASAVQCLPWETRVRIAHQVAVALQTLHTNVPGRRRAIVHRDVKSANILLDGYGNARLADTGLSRELGEGKSGISTATGPGTPGYCYPYASEGPYYAHFDWFSFGVVLLELVLQKPAARTDELCLYKWLHKKQLLFYDDYPKLGAPKSQALVDEYHELWKGCEASRKAADWLFHIAVHCISAEPGPNQHFYCDEIHCKNWLGFTGSSSSSNESEESSCWSELTPVKLLRELCISNGISFFNNVEPPTEDMVTAASAGAALKRCAACFIMLNSKDVGGLHTLSSLCQPEECMWYCPTCLRSGEPVYCLKHGRAQPIIGGENAHVIAVSGSGKGADIFKQDCQRLRATLTDARFAGMSHSNVKVIAAPVGDEVRLAILSLTLRLEERVIHAALSRSSRDLCPGLKCPEKLEEAIRSVCAFVRKKAALRRLGQHCHHLQLLPSGLTESQRDRLLAKLVDIVWSRTERLSPTADVRAAQLLAMTGLWSLVEPGEPCDALDVSQQQLPLMDATRLAENRRLEAVARQHKLVDAERLTLKRLADECFVALISSCCIPTSAVELLKEHGADVLLSVTCLTQCVGEKMLATAAQSIAESLRPLTDGLVWYHYCGHSSGEQERLPDAALPKDLLEAAGRLVANLIVTLDCCHANASAPKLRFYVDELAPYSGYAVLSSCTAAQESQFGRSTAFTEFLICGLRSATDDCRRAFERAFRGRTCSKPGCAACAAYRAAGEQQPCSACERLRSRAGGCLQLVDIFEYVKAHLCVDLMRPVLDSSYAERHLPVAYFQPRPPTYDVHVRLPSSDGLAGEADRVVCLNDVPATVEQLKISLLAEILRSMKDEKAAPDMKLAPVLACQLARCNMKSHDSSVGASENLHVARMHQDCIYSALQLIDRPDSSHSCLIVENVTSNAQEDLCNLHASGGQAPVHAGSAVQCQDIGDLSCSQPTVTHTGACSVESSAVSPAEKAVLDKVLSQFTFRTAISEVATDELMRTMFRKGFTIYCSIHV